MCIAPGNWTAVAGAQARRGGWEWTTTATPRTNSTAAALSPSCVFLRPNCATQSHGLKPRCLPRPTADSRQPTAVSRQLPETATACVHPAPCAAPRPCGAGGTGCQPASPGGGISLGRALCITLAACKPGSTCGRARAGKESALVLTGRYCCNCNASCLSWRLRSNGNASSSPYGALYQLP